MTAGALTSVCLKLWDVDKTLHHNLFHLKLRQLNIYGGLTFECNRETCNLKIILQSQVKQ